MSCILLSYNNDLSSFAVCDGEACHFQFYNYCYSTMSTPGRCPILANLKPSPLNIQSAKASTSKTPKQHVSTPSTSKGSTLKDGTRKCSLAPNRHDEVEWTSMKKNQRRTGFSLSGPSIHNKASYKESKASPNVTQDLRTCQ